MVCTSLCPKRWCQVSRSVGWFRDPPMIAMVTSSSYGWLIAKHMGCCQERKCEAAGQTIYRQQGVPRVASGVFGFCRCRFPSCQFWSAIAAITRKWSLHPKRQFSLIHNIYKSRDLHQSKYLLIHVTSGTFRIMIYITSSRDLHAAPRLLYILVDHVPSVWF